MVEVPSPKVKKAPSMPAALLLHVTQPSTGSMDSEPVTPEPMQPALELLLVVELAVEVAAVLVATVEVAVVVGALVVEAPVVFAAPVVVPAVVVEATFEVLVACPTEVLVTNDVAPELAPPEEPLVEGLVFDEAPPFSEVSPVVAVAHAHTPPVKIVNVTRARIA